MAPFLRLKWERIRHGLSQMALAKKSGIAQTTISNIERGRINPTEEELVKLANALLFSPAGHLMHHCTAPDLEPETQPAAELRMLADKEQVGV